MTNELKKLFTITTIMLMIFTWTNPLITAAYEIVGEPEHPSLTIFKYEQDPDAQPEDNNEQRPNIPADAKPLPDVTYEIKLLEEYIASENDWQPTEKDLTLQKTTDQEGKIVFTESDGLILGKYSIQEIDAPAHVIMDSEVYTVDIPMTTKDGSLYYDVHVHPKNETIYGDLELIKLDET